MRIARHFKILLLIFLLWPLAGIAQDDDKGFLTKLLQDSLAGEGRNVQINGFEGAFSSRAVIQSITVADTDGIWLTLSDVAIEWNRSALLRGRIEIAELSAASIDVPRLPLPVDDGLPPAEAQGFSLPELPVAVVIEDLSATEITLGTQLLGEEIVLGLKAALSLDDGAAVSLLAERRDGKTGRFQIETTYAGDGLPLTLSIDLTEGEDGIAARLIDLPGRPSVALAINGDGPLDDFATDIALSTDGTERLEGRITLQGADQGGGRLFDADIKGDIAALFAPQYQDFFGREIALRTKGQQFEDGALTLEDLSLVTNALELNGSVRLNAESWPTFIALDGRIKDRDGSPVLLPLPGDQTKVASVGLKLNFDQSRDEVWTGTFAVDQLARPDLSIDHAGLDISGVLRGDGATPVQITADIDGSLTGLAIADTALMAAVGENISGKLGLSFSEGQSVTLSDLAVKGEGFAVSGDAVIGDLDDGFETTFDLALVASQIERFSALAGRPLSGQADVTMAGTAGLGGAFDLALDGRVTDLTIDVEQADTLLAGQTDLTLKARRSEDGTFVDQLDVRNAALTLTADATLQSEQSDVRFDAALDDIARIVADQSGPVSAKGSARQRGDIWSVDLAATAPYDIETTIKGSVTGPDAEIAYDAIVPDIAPLVPGYSGQAQLRGVLRPEADGWAVETDLNGPYQLDATLAGRVVGANAPDISYKATLPDVSPFVHGIKGGATLDGTLARRGTGFDIETDIKGPYGLSAKVAGILEDGSSEFEIDARLPDVAPVVPQLAGPLAVSGSAKQSEVGWTVDATTNGPSGSAATVKGLIRDSGTLDIAASGIAPLGLANPFLKPRSLSGQAQFDLRVDGAPSLSSLTGTVAATGARFSAPDLKISLRDLAIRTALANGQANVDVTSSVVSGGRLAVSGPIAVAPPFRSDLSATLTDIQIIDPQLFRTRLDGNIGINGNLTGGAVISGRVDVGETLVTIPNAPVASFGIIPEITHRRAGAGVVATQRRAGLLGDGAASSNASGPSYPLNLTINAPNRLFVRGRGLDAELGGGLSLSGTTNNIVSAGRFALIRGRLDILEKRFDLDEGTVQLQGDLDPFIRFVATTPTEAGSASMIIDGLASAPDLRFEATPDAPEDEILAQIFFGRDATQLSAFQALQLANAVATLAGRGGEGVVSKLRRAFNLDDLDITTDADGNTGLRFGKYISDNAYTDVTIGSDNTAGVSINIDLSPALTARGQLKSDGSTSLGLFYEKDY